MPDPQATTKPSTDARRTADLIYSRRESLVAGILGSVPAGERRSLANDVGLDLDALESALRIGEPGVFSEHCAWRARVLRSRGLDVESVRVFLEAAGRQLRALDPAAGDRVAPLLAAGEAALQPTAKPSGGAEEPRRGSEPAALVDALLRSDRRAAEAILQRARSQGTSAAQIADEIVQPAMRAIGWRWECNDVTVADEHVASAILQSALAHQHDASPATSTGKRVVLACVEGNLHSMGLRVVADALEDAGWEVDFLGADVPARDLVALLRARPANVVGLSIALPTQLPAARRAVDVLRGGLGADCPSIAVGGYPLLARVDLADYLAADRVFTSAGDAVASL